MILEFIGVDRFSTRMAYCGVWAQKTTSMYSPSIKRSPALLRLLMACVYYVPSFPILLGKERICLLNWHLILPENMIMQLW